MLNKIPSLISFAGVISSVGVTCYALALVFHSHTAWQTMEILGNFTATSTTVMITILK